MHIAYLVNRYLKFNRGFTRREILLLEERVSEILRIAICGWKAMLAAAQALGNRESTRCILGSVT